jgi:spermidine/putrescine transport system permease protein
MRLANALCGGWTVLVLIFLYFPIVFLVVYSFNSSRLNIVWESFTLKWYAELLGNKRLVDAFINSIVIACSSTALAVLLGTGGAWLLYRFRYRRSGVIETAAYLPMVVPEVIMGISLLVFFKSISLQLGFATVILAHATFCFPFVMAAVRARLAGLDPSLEEAAMDLGAGPARAFFHVIVPYLMPAIAAGGLMAFALSLDEVIVSYFTTSASSITLPLRIYGMAKVGLNPMINALSTIFVAVTAVILIVMEISRQKRRPAAGT